MNLTDLNVRDLDKLLACAEHEKSRRATRKSADNVRRMLKAEAVRLGYELAEVFPEMVIRARAVPVGESMATAKQTPGAAARPDGARKHASPDVSLRPGRPSAVSKQESLGPVDVARQIVRALKSRDAFSAHLSVPLDALLQQMGMTTQWAAFHAGMEEANRRNWVHFRGNSHCVLTAEGDAAALAW